NNIPQNHNNNRTGMVGYELKKFNGYSTEDSEEHIEEFRLWLTGSGIDVGAGYANRINAHSVFRAFLKGDAKDCKGHEKNNYSSNMGMTENEVRNLVKSMMISEQSQSVSQTISSKPQRNQSNQITLSQDDFKKIIAGLKGTITKGQQTLKKPPGPEKQKADDLVLDHLLENLIDDPGLPEEDYDYNPVEDLRL
ncbi:8735_t:CDS:2, partial [Funneliformis caledonium]